MKLALTTVCSQFLNFHVHIYDYTTAGHAKKNYFQVLAVLTLKEGKTKIT